MKKATTLSVNGNEHEVLVPSHRTLLEVLREELGLMGTKSSCDMGTCGSCTVLIDGLPVLSCLTLAHEVEGREITTIEGLRGEEGRLHPLERSFVEHGAIQCGFCTPGMILASQALLNEKPHPSEEEIRQALAGHLCRCTGYVQIVDAVQAAAESTEA
jgi:aerobic-type carbon monoxide dehydrogenase small subunit (CoxS/CutS family)